MKKNGERTKGGPPRHTIGFAPENDKHPWTRIGAMWPTKSGKGFQLKIEFVPTNPGRIFALPYEPKTREIETESAGDKKTEVRSC